MPCDAASAGDGGVAGVQVIGKTGSPVGSVMAAWESGQRKHQSDGEGKSKKVNEWLTTDATAIATTSIPA